VLHETLAGTVFVDQVYEQHRHVRLGLGNVDAVDVDHLVGRGEVFHADRTAEMIRSPERDVQPEFFVEQHLADRLDAHGGEDSEARLGEVRVGGSGADLLRRRRRPG
jgi:hypothetical protein